MKIVYIIEKRASGSDLIDVKLAARIATNSTV